MKPSVKRNGFAWVMVVLLIVSVSLAFISISGFKVVERDKIVIVPLQGIIISGDTDESGYVSSALFTRTLYRLKDDDRVKAIVIVVNSPGGTPSASYEIARSIDDVKKSKPVIAFLGDMATSGAYYAISPSTRIVALPDTVTGSLGVIWVIENKEGYYEDKGIKFFVYKSGEMKDIGAPWREPTSEEKELINSTIQEIFSRMMNEISDSRNLSEPVIEELSDARILTGYQAYQAGLVDEIGTLHSAIEMAKDLSGIESPELKYIELREIENISARYLEESFSGYPFS